MHTTIISTHLCIFIVSGVHSFVHLHILTLDAGGACLLGHHCAQFEVPSETANRGSLLVRFHQRLFIGLRRTEIRVQVRSMSDILRKLFGKEKLNDGSTV